MMRKCHRSVHVVCMGAMGGLVAHLRISDDARVLVVRGASPLASHVSLKLAFLLVKRSFNGGFKTYADTAKHLLLTFDYCLHLRLPG